MFDGPRHVMTLRQGDLMAEQTWRFPGLECISGGRLQSGPLGEHLSQRVTRSDLCYGQITLPSTVELGQETAASMGAGDRAEAACWSHPP